MVCHLNRFLHWSFWLKGSTSIVFNSWFKERIYNWSLRPNHFLIGLYARQLQEVVVVSSKNHVVWAFTFGSIFCQAFKRIADLKISGDISKNSLLREYNLLKYRNLLLIFSRGFCLVFRTVMLRITSGFKPWDCSGCYEFAFVNFWIAYDDFNLRFPMECMQNAKFSISRWVSKAGKDKQMDWQTPRHGVFFYKNANIC